MTEEERENEKVRCLAAAVYNALHECGIRERYIRTIFAKHGEHQAFVSYMTDMALTGALNEFIGRAPLKQTA